MSSRHQNLSRGQALFAGALGSIVSRWRAYILTCLATAACGAYGGFSHLPLSAQRAAQDYAHAKLMLELLVFASDTPTGPEPASARALVSHAFYQQAAERGLEALQWGGLVGLLFGVALCAAWAYLVIRWGETAAEDNARRGASVVTERTLARLTRKRAGQDAIRLASVPLPTALETRHVALIGSTGSGKTTALRQMLDAIDKRGDTAIVYDTSGEFIAHYYKPERGDIILNAFDARGAFWSPFEEIHHPADADHIARQLVASTGAAEQDIWLDAARILVADVLRKLHAEGRTDLSTLIDTLGRLSRDQLKDWLADTSSARMFEQGAERASGSVLFMLARCVQLLQYLRASPEDATVFSFRAHFEALDQRTGERPWIFVPRQEQYFAAMRPLLACFLECAATAILGLSPHPSRRIWLMLDELADLPKVDNLARLLPLGRKFGASVVVTFQALGQMRERYGRDGAEALLANTNTKLFLQLADPDTRQWASQAVGTVETEIRGASENLDHQVGKGRTSIGSTRQILPLLLESQFRLPPYQGYLQLPDAYPVARVAIRNDHIVARGRAKHQAFVAIDLEKTLWGAPRPPVVEPTSNLTDGGPV
jgi:energy-coupling factor transporter ATP-binding protein EcfA2